MLPQDSTELTDGTQSPVDKAQQTIEQIEQPTRSRFNLTISSVGLTITLLLILAIAAFVNAPEEWYRWVFAGLIIGFTLGAVFGIWIGRRIGNAPNLQKLSFATGIVVLNACVGFFGYAYLTSEKESPGILPNRETFFYSIGTASTLVSATILCLVNFFWHSRDQQRINTLRAVVNKSRAKIAEANVKITAAQTRVEEANAQAEQQRRRAEEAERQLDEERKKAEQAQKDAEQARTSAHGAQKTAQQAQQIAEKEKRWRSRQALLLGRWQCVEYSARPRGAKDTGGNELFKERDEDKDILHFGRDGSFSVRHPGKPLGFMEKLKARVGTLKQDDNDVPREKTGRWNLHESGDTLSIQYEDGASETVKIQTINKNKLSIDKSSEQWELFRFLVKVG